MFEGALHGGVPTEWIAKVKDGAALLKRARLLVDATIGKRQ